MTDDFRPLVVTADEDLLDDALRWCAAVGATPDVAPDVSAARRGWRSASAVLVGADLLEHLAAAGLPRRDGVIAVATDPQRVWPAGIAVGAAALFSRADEHGIVGALADAHDGPREGCLVALVSGAGGVGATTIAALVAERAAQEGLRALLLDADPFGGGADLVLGLERAEGIRWGDLGDAGGRLDAVSIAAAMPAGRGAGVLTWAREAEPRLPAACTDVVAAAVRGHDLVVADVGRMHGSAAVRIVEDAVLTVLVAGSDVAALAAARRTANRVREVAASAAVVAVARRNAAPRSVVGEVLELPVLARHRFDPRLAAAVDRGSGIGRSWSGRRTARRVLRALGLTA